MITATAAALVTVLSVIRWQIKELRFMPFESLLCLVMIVLAIEIISKFLA